MRLICFVLLVFAFFGCQSTSPTVSRSQFEKVDSLARTNDRRGLEAFRASGGSYEQIGPRGGTALVAALWRNDLAAFRLLLEVGANPNTRLGPEATEWGKKTWTIWTPDAGTTLIWMAAHKSTPQFLEELIARGADVNFRNEPNGETGFFGAIDGRNPEHVRMLLRAGADPNIQTIRYGRWAPVAYAAISSSWEYCYDLVKGGAEPIFSTPSDPSLRAAIEGDLNPPKTSGPRSQLSPNLLGWSIGGIMVQKNREYGKKLLALLDEIEKTAIPAQSKP